MRHVPHIIDIYQIEVYDQDGHLVETIDGFETQEDAEACLLQCQEGDDKHDPMDYYITSTAKEI